MSTQTMLVKPQELDDILDDYYYVAWHIVRSDDKKEVKSYSVGYPDPKKVLALALNNELGDRRYIYTVHTGFGLKSWLKSKTIPDPEIPKIFSLDIRPKIGDEISFSDEGSFIVKGFGIYKYELGSIKWVLMTSLRTGCDIVMSLKSLNFRILRRSSPHKRLNFTLLDNTKNKDAYWFTVGYLLNHSEIHIRTTPKTHTEVVERYEKVTGCPITKHCYEEGYIVYNDNDLTFTDNADIRVTLDSPEVRDALYFPKNKIGKREGGLIEPNLELFHNLEFVWTLFTYGFRLGKKHNVKEVTEYVRVQAKKYIKDFERGYNL
jgi:hypothetical protein